MNRTPLHDALRASGWTERVTVSDWGTLKPGDTVRVWSKRGERDIVEKCGRDWFAEFEHFALFATSAAYRAKVHADIEAEREQGIGTCPDCPMGHQHDGMLRCIEDDCDCPTRTP
jgi:hypothetical protein